jgi:CheY-like chemotaxis protein
MAKGRILIVEDEQIVAWDLQQRLTRLGYTVLGIVSSGEAAIAKALELAPDLVLTDIRLPGEVDGVQAALHIQARMKTVIVYMTAYGDEHTVQRALESHPATVLRKPLQNAALQRALESVLGAAGGARDC